MQTKDNKEIIFDKNKEAFIIKCPILILKHSISKVNGLLNEAKCSLEDIMENESNQEYFYKNESTYNHYCDIQDSFESIDSIEGDLFSLCERLENES